MKTITKQLFKGIPVIVAFAGLLATGINIFAIEGIHLSVQSSNVILSWPSTNNGESYIIQYRQTLSTTDSWQTLADYYSPASNTNITFYTNFNVVQNFYSYGDSSSQNTMALATAEPITPVPMAVPTNGSGNGVPLSLYPPGFDLSGFLILDPATGESVSGAVYSISSFALNNPLDGPPSPDGGSGGSGGASPAPETGFYRVVRDGAHLFGITNGMTLSGVVTIPVELANGSGTVTAMSLTEDDSPVGNSIQAAPLNSPLALVVDTTQMTNGVHQISASAAWNDTNANVWEADSPPISVTVSNEISFENWMPTFGETGNTLLFRATSAHTNTDWVVSIYDNNNTYLGYFSGHTDNGDISFYWDYSGTIFTNTPSFSFEIATEYVDPPAPKVYKVTDPWPGEGAWCEVCQHAFDNAIDSETLYQELNPFVGIAGAMGANLYPNPSDDGSPYPLTYGADNPQGDTDWANFRQALYNPLTRNLVYFGHGTQTGLGGNPANINRFITATEIANTLHTIPAGQTNRHAFRFVFIDACSTAKGTMPESFGILHRENVLAGDYVDSSTRFSAYVGWPKDKFIGILDGSYINYDHVSFIQDIQTEMILYGRTIKDAIINASNYADTHGSFGPDSLVVYGFWNLTVGGYNN